ncbi:putative polyubiquitin binding protein [Mollisia scopiformis]|uniref:Putative polyubiquitin binding protein n=1 Tax=Mollisia scopiformis TaxID=149040 RepID=A0A132BAQ2_MOLSC|nr:putative polyubiquitin binding protein [Mollisia scopiformis]KUJ09495.1 putative polyubiquitin binding protein [Mollisia scopiformis]
MAAYKLSASLSGHDDDVRGVAFPTSKAVLSASRDGTVRLWKLTSENHPVYDDTISSHAGAWMNTVAYLPPNAEYPEGLIVSSGKDVVIDVRQPSRAAEDNAEALLLGHSRDVCALDIDQEGKYIVSGSWDHDARIWPIGKWESDIVLRGHEGTVWAVLAYDPEKIITGCADQKIRLFHKSGKLLNTFQASRGPIRALCRVPKGHPSGADFASADNEGIIRLWSISGKQIAELHGHESFIYSLAALPTGELASSGEDRTVRIWKGTECIQTITHPAISVWGVAVCAENGDIVSGASDKVVRVFTRSEERVAAAETVAQFDEAVKGSSIPQQTVSVNKENLPGPQFLTQKSGTKDGQVQMIKELNGAVTAHTWSAAENQWINVGTVVDAVGSSGKKVDYLGQEYDFVFDVDIEDGKPPLKLPYNLASNPYEAATKFIQDNELPITYLDQVANFITTNTQGATVGPAAPAPTGPDPWGSENRYRPGETNAPSVTAPPKILPQKDYLNILVARIPAMQKKITELNQALLAEGRKDISMNPTELTVLSNLCKHLETVGATKTSQSVRGGLDLAIKLAIEWPYKDRLPGLDLLRLLVVAPDTATFTHSGGANIVDILEVGATETETPAENHVMMAVRAFANLFESMEGRQLAVREFDKIQKVITASIANSTNRNLLVAASTVYINYSVYFKSEGDKTSFEHVLAVLDILGKILSTQTDSEAVYRALVATGTLLTLDDEIKSAAKDVYGIEKSVSTAVGKAMDPRIKNLAGEIRGLLK